MTINKKCIYKQYNKMLYNLLLIFFKKKSHINFTENENNLKIFEKIWKYWNAIKNILKKKKKYFTKYI